MEQPDLSAMDHAAKDDLIRFLFAQVAELKSRITALEVRPAKDRKPHSPPWDNLLLVNKLPYAKNK